MMVQIQYLPIHDKHCANDMTKCDNDMTNGVVVMTNNADMTNGVADMTNGVAEMTNGVADKTNGVAILEKGVEEEEAQTMPVSRQDLVSPEMSLQVSFQKTFFQF